MATLPANYPIGCTDDQIQQAIVELSQDILRSQANINTVLQLGPLMQIGLNELQKRATDKLNKVSELNLAQTGQLTKEVTQLKTITKQATDASDVNQKAAQRLTVIATWLTVASIVLALITAFLAYATTQTDKQWQQQEIQLLQSIRQNTQLK